MYTSIIFSFCTCLHDSFLCCIRKYMYDGERPICTCKDMITCWSWSVLPATDSNSTVLHFDSLNKPDLSWPYGPVAVLSLTQSLSKILWDPLFRSFTWYYALCFLRNQHTYPESFTIVWSSMLNQNILTIHFLVIMSYNFHSFTWQADIVTLLFVHPVYLVNQNTGLCY